MKNFLIFCTLASAVIGTLSGCQTRPAPVEIYNSGVVQYNSGQYAKAIGMFKWSLERGREYAPALLGLAKTYLALSQQAYSRKQFVTSREDLEHALHWAGQAIMADPGNPETFQVKIDILKMRGQVEGAINTARRAAKLAGPSPTTMIMLANTYLDQGDFDNALIALRQGLRITPDHVALTVELARLYEATGRKSAALEQYERAYKIDPYYPGVLEKVVELRARSTDK